MGKEMIGFVGVGQAGANVCKELAEKGFKNIAVINSSSDDLKTVENQISKRLLLGTKEGCAKSRANAKEIMQEKYKEAVEFIKETFIDSKIKIVYFIFSAGGGTGSGMTPVLINILRQLDFDKEMGAMVIYPSVKEDIQALLNTSEALKELYSLNIPVINIDNNKADKKLHNLLQINKNIADYFDTFMEDGKYSQYGNIDKMEKLTILSTPGSIVFSKSINFKLNEKELAEKIRNDLNNGDFVQIENDEVVNSSSMLLEVQDENNLKNLNLDILNDIPGNAVKHFKGVHISKRMMVMMVYSGLSYPASKIEKINNIIEDFKDNKYKKSDSKKLEGIFNSSSSSDLFDIKPKSKPTNNFGVKIDIDKIDIKTMF